MIFSLVVLIALTMIGISAMNTSMLQGKIASNARNQDLAFQSAESALINSESWLMCQSSQVDATADGSSNIWIQDTIAVLDDMPDTWWKTNATVFGLDIDFNDTQELTGVEAEPRYVIEHLSNGATEFGGCIPENLNMNGGQARTRCLYRITARGTGADQNTQVVLRSHFALHYPRNLCKEARL